VRINAQLIEAASGGHIWAERFDGDLADIFELQDRITESVVGAIEPSVRRAEIARARAKPTGNLDAYDLYLRAVHQCYAMTRESMNAAVAFLRQALDIDPEYALARGFLAFVYCVRDALGQSDPGDGETATALAREAIAADDANPATLRAAGHALSHFGADYAGAFAALNRALALHPASVHVLLSLGMLNCWAGEPEAAIDYMRRAIRISPRDHELGHMLAGIGAALLRCNRNEEAAAISYQTVGEMPNFMPGHRNLVHALVRLGRIDEARAAGVRLLAINPQFRTARMTRPFRDQAFIEDYLAAMRSVGLPE
jgi:adenylate cyclase